MVPIFLAHRFYNLQVMNSQFILPVSIHSNRQQKVLIQTKCDSVCARATFTLPIQYFTFFEYVNFHLKNGIQNICIDLLLNSIPIKCPSYRSYPKLVITLELFLLILPAGGAGTDLELHMCLGLISQIHAFNFFSSLGLLTRPFGQPQNKHLFVEKPPVPVLEPNLLAPVERSL